MVDVGSAPARAILSDSLVGLTSDEKRPGSKGKATDCLVLPRNETSCSGGTPKLGNAIRRRLERAAADHGDLIQRFVSADGTVPAVALFFDKGFRRTAYVPGATAVECLQEVLKVAHATDGLDVEELPRASVRLSVDPAFAEVSPMEATSSPADGGERQRGPSRNFKGELQALLCKHLGRPIDRTDMIFSSEKICDIPPSFVCTVEALGSTYRGEACPLKKAAEQSAAEAVLKKLDLEGMPGGVVGQRQGIKHEDIADEEDSSGDEGREASLTNTHLPTEVSTINYKGQLLDWLQDRLGRPADSVHFHVKRCGFGEKTFQATVIIAEFKTNEFTGDPQTRAAHGSSVRARQAAQQSAARVALEALQKTGSASHGLTAREQRTLGLRIPSDARKLPVLEEVKVHDDDFLAAAARALGCRDAFPHPLQWAGTRPKGLCMYEIGNGDTTAFTAQARPNERAAFLIGGGAAVFGDALLLDASAHTKGAELTDVTGARYELLKADRLGALSDPRVALNATRGMLVAGALELPLRYDPACWVGHDPRSLFHEVLRRRGSAITPRYIVQNGQLGGLHRVRVCWGAADEKDAAESMTVLGSTRKTKAEAHQDAALAALHALCDGAPPPLASPCQLGQSKLSISRYDAFGEEVLPVLRFDEGIPIERYGAEDTERISLAVEFRITLARSSDAETNSLTVEERKLFRCEAGSGVLHPALQRLALAAPAGQRCFFESDFLYDGFPTKAKLELLVTERSLCLRADAQATGKIASTRPFAEDFHTEKGSCSNISSLPTCAPTTSPSTDTLVFDPPLWRQRCNFIARTLAAHGARNVVDLGCGDGRMLEALLLGSCGGSLELLRVVGVDHSADRHRIALRRLELARKATNEEQTTEVIVADFLVPDERWSGMDAIILAEVVEHIPDAKLPQVAAALFVPSPRIVVVTTPNADFYPTGPRSFRHSDHEREWTRDEFKAWASQVAAAYGYDVAEISGVGEAPAGFEAGGPCTQIVVFTKAAGPATTPTAAPLTSQAGEIACADATSGQTHPSGPDGGDAAVARTAEIDGQGGTDTPSTSVVAGYDVQASFGFEAPVDVSNISKAALRVEEIAPNMEIEKFVMREGEGDVPPERSRVTVHHAMYLETGKLVSSSRDGKRSEPCAFQLGGGKVLEAWHRAVATMRLGEASWIRSVPSFTFGAFGCPPLIPVGAVLWIALELIDFKLPGTVRVCRDAASALEESERHMETGRSALQRQAFVQARQAFRRARDSVPEKLLLGQPEQVLRAYAKMDRSSLLNQALCAQKLAEAPRDDAEPNQSAKQWEDVVRVCSLLLDRHLGAPVLQCGQQEAKQGPHAADKVLDELAEPPREIKADSFPTLAAAWRSISATDGQAQWVTKAYFRRASARRYLNDITDAVDDLIAAQRFAPNDPQVEKLLSELQTRQKKVDLKPEKMFTGILERANADRDREDAAKALAEKKRRREERLRKQAAAAALAP
eukprot:TRINITY_DN48719_c0_g1_i1.p1 TRINITY_DN48719_c0_g1~~TRINITY_DN48719_c0_g1_i1.p1  ORF type:complete len:1480 (-),score=308.56 TRINITY_DN48719_c0_g1_i1:102-4541(-)